MVSEKGDTPVAEVNCNCNGSPGQMLELTAAMVADIVAATVRVAGFEVTEPSLLVHTA